jgi:hypothetical protein
MPICGMSSAPGGVAGSGAAGPTEGSGAFVAFQQALQPPAVPPAACGGSIIERQISWQPSVCTSTGNHGSILAAAAGDPDPALAQPASAEQQQPQPPVLPLANQHNTFMPFGAMHQAPLSSSST